MQSGCLLLVARQSSGIRRQGKEDRKGGLRLGLVALVQLHDKRPKLLGNSPRAAPSRSRPATGRVPASLLRPPPADSAIDDDIDDLH